MAFRRNNYNRNRKRDNNYRPRRERIPGPAVPANVTVVPRKNEPIEKTIRRFVRKCKKEKIIEQVRKRRYYQKPSEAKREKRAASIREAARQKRKAERKREAYRKRQSKLRRMNSRRNNNGST